MKDRYYYYSDGTILNYWDGTKTLHREGAPAIECASGSKIWYLNGKLHREGAPAIEWANGSQKWYLHGELHREDGPAIEHPDGEGFWYLNGVQYTEEKYWQLIKKISSSTISTLSKEPPCTCGSWDLARVGCQCQYAEWKRKLSI